MVGALILIAVIVALVGLAVLLSGAPNRRTSDPPRWLAWLIAVPFLGPALGGSSDDDGGGGDGGGGFDGGGGDGGGGGGGGE